MEFDDEFPRAVLDASKRDQRVFDKFLHRIAHGRVRRSRDRMCHLKHHTAVDTNVLATCYIHTDIYKLPVSIVLTTQTNVTERGIDMQGAFIK